MARKKAAEKEPANTQIAGMRGVYLVAAELSRLGFIVAPTSRGAKGADLLVTDQNCRRTFSVQVKTKTTSDAFWLVGRNVDKEISKSHIYVLVRIRKLKTLISDENKEGEIIECYVVPSKILSENTGHYEFSNSIQRKYIEEYRDEWKKCFGDPHE